MQTHKQTHTHTLPPPARGLLVKLKGVSTYPHTPLLSLSSSLILIKRLVSEAPSGVAGGDCGCRAGKRDGDERSSPAERLRAYLENTHAFSENRGRSAHTRSHCTVCLKQRDEGTRRMSCLMNQNSLNQNTHTQQSSVCLPLYLCWLSFISSSTVVAVGGSNKDGRVEEEKVE